VCELARWWIVLAAAVIMVGILAPVTLTPKKRMEVRITDLRYEWQVSMVSWAVPTNRTGDIYTFFLLGIATNHGDPGWVTVLGYYESEQGRFEKELDFHLSNGTSRIIFTDFSDVGGPNSTTTPKEFRYGFEVVRQQAD